MQDSDQDWQTRFAQLLNQTVEKYRQGHEKAAGIVDESGQKFLRSIGYTEQELFDFAEDLADGGEPTVATAVELASIRRDYFLNEQKGVFSSRIISTGDLPAKDAQVDGIGWLPRIIPKAKAKLRGEMPPDLMYDCGGDRKFFRTHQIDPAEFLRQTWKAEGDDTKVITWVKSQIQSR